VNGGYFGRGFNLPHFLGHIYELKGWIPRCPAGGFSFCESILLMTIVTSLVTIKLNGGTTAAGEKQEGTNS